MMKTVITGVLAALLAGALGFWGGVQYQKAQSPSFSSNFRNGNFAGGGNFSGQVPNGQQGSARRFAGGVTTGTVLAIDSASITVKSATGGSKTVYISSTTNFGKQETIKVTDIKVGDNVMAVGQSSSGGITARSVQVVPPGTDFRGSFGFGGPGQ